MKKHEKEAHCYDVDCRIKINFDTANFHDTPTLLTLTT